MSASRRCALSIAVALLLPISALAQPGDEDLPALYQQVLQLYQSGKYAEAITPARQAIEVAERRFGPDHPKVGTALYTLAAVYQTLSRYADAEPLLKRTLGLLEGALGPDHGDVGAPLSNLAGLYRAQRRYAEAEPLYKRALAIREKSLGTDHADVAKALDNLADFYQEQGRYSEAEPLHIRSLATTERALGSEHPSVTNSLNNLARLYFAQARYAEAEPLFQRSLSLVEKVQGPDHPNFATALNNLAEFYQAQGRYDDAEPLHRRALTITEKALGPEHALVAGSLHNLAKLYHVQGRFSDAELLYQRGLSIWEKTLGSDHPNVATALNNVALLHSAQGRLAEAEPAFRRALGITEKALGPDHPELGTSLNNLAELYRSQGRYADAEPLYQRALAIEDRVLGPDHPRVGTRLNNLALLYAAQGRYSDSEPLFMRALDSARATLGADHPEVSTSLNNLAAFHFTQGQLAKAADYWRQSTDAIIRRVKRGTERVGSALTGEAKSEVARLSYQFSTLVRVVHRLAEVEPTRGSELAREMFKTAQWAQASEAAASLAQMAARQAKGGGALARLARERQDLVGEWQVKDKLLIAARSEPPARRQAQAETALTARLAAIDDRVAEIDKALAKDFPDYAALAHPQPVGIADVQAQLGANEALVLFLDTPEWKPQPAETFLWAITKANARWVRAELGNTSLKERIAALRCGLDSSAWYGEGAPSCAHLLKTTPDRAPREGEPLPFDLTRAHDLYRALFSQVADLINNKHLLVVPSGPLTQLPFQVLVTGKPDPTLAGAKAFRRAAWLAWRHAITVLPAVSSLIALRQHAKTSRATKPLVGFGNPLLDGPDDRHAARAKLAREKQQRPRPASERIAGSLVGSIKTIKHRGGLADVADVRAQIPLPETADELCAVARDLKSADGDIHLGGRATERDIRLSATMAGWLPTASSTSRRMAPLPASSTPARNRA